MSRRTITQVSGGVLARAAADGVSYFSGPKGDRGYTGATGATGADGVTTYAILYWGDFTDGISGSTGASGATAALTATSTYTDSDVWFPQNVVYHQTAASDDSNEDTVGNIYIEDTSVTGEDTLDNLTGVDTFHSTQINGGPVLTGEKNVYLEVTGTFEGVTVYVYGVKKHDFS